MSNWQPIKTAPRNGSPILLRLAKPLNSNDIDGYAPWEEISTVIGWWGGGHWMICFMEEGSADSFGYSSNFFMNMPTDFLTHWQPLPEPPE